MDSCSYYQCAPLTGCNFTCHHQCVNKVYLDCGGNSAHVNPAINHSRHLPAMSKYAKRSKQRVAVTIGTKSQVSVHYIELEFSIYGVGIVKYNSLLGSGFLRVCPFLFLL